MSGRFVILLCLVALFIGIEGKPIARRIKHQHKNVGHEHSIVKLNFSQNTVNRGLTIRISGKRNAKQDMTIINILPAMFESQRNRKSGSRDLNQVKVRKGRRVNPVQKRKLMKPQSNILKALAAMKNHSENDINWVMNSHENKNKVILRSKRSVSKNLAGKNEMQIENLGKFIESDDSDEEASNDSIENKSFNDHQSAVNHDQQHKSTKFVNSEDYRDYAFDTADNDHINEDNDLLERYYHPKRRAAYDDYGTFTDLMRIAATETERENQMLRRVHYGDGLMNDDIEGSDDTDNAGDDEVYDEYKNYDDDY